MNDFFWGDGEDRELENFNSELMSIHELENVLGRSCPSSSEQTFGVTFVQSDSDRTNNELESVEGDTCRRIDFLEDLLNNSQNVSKEQEASTEIEEVESPQHPHQNKEERDDDDDDEDYLNGIEDDDDEDYEDEPPNRKRIRTRSYTRSQRAAKRRLKCGLTLSSSLGYALTEDPRSAEHELDQLIHSATDPVGKFLRKLNISARDAIRLNIHGLLLQCPRKIREKYGPRHEVDEEERAMINRERNREHARATRQRRRIFKEIQEILQKKGV